jgi:hypothetical protein
MSNAFFLQSSPDPEPGLFIPDAQPDPISFTDLLRHSSFSPSLPDASVSPDLPRLPSNIPIYPLPPIDIPQQDEDGLYDEDTGLDRGEVLSDGLQSDTDELGASKQTRAWRIDHSKGDHKLNGILSHLPSR